jgi:hypothetical protein
MDAIPGPIKTGAPYMTPAGIGDLIRIEERRPKSGCGNGLGPS